MPLPEERRKQLDGIVQKMDSDGASTPEIQTIVDDFKRKYDGPATLASPEAAFSGNPARNRRQQNLRSAGTPVPSMAAEQHARANADLSDMNPVSRMYVGGLLQAAGGAQKVQKAPSWWSPEAASGYSDMFRGVASAHLPMLAPQIASAAVAAPIAFGTSALVGTVAQQGTERGLEAIGVPKGYSQLASDVAGIAVPAAASRWFSPKPKEIGPVLNNKNNPVEQEALDSLRGQVRMSAGQQTGNRGVQRVEQGLENIWGASGKAQEFFRGQEGDLAQVGRKVINTPGTQRTNPVGAGEGLVNKLEGRLTALKGYADKLYDSTRKTTAANVKEVQTGVKDVPASTILDASGSPAIPAHQVPVISKMETPVDIAPVKARLGGIYEDLMRSLPEARRANSPAFRALQDVMDSDAQQMNAMDFDKFLSAVKSLSRDGNSQNLTSKSQGIAKQIIKAGESEFQKAIGTAGPNVASKLKQARTAVREYYDMDEFMSALHDEPAKVYDFMVNGGDRALGSLRYVNRTAPKETQTIGRTFLEGLIDKATAEGGFRRAPGVMAEWNRLGPETKTLLFGKTQAKNIDNFMLGAKRLTESRNPSGTAGMLTALEGLGATGAALYSLVTGNPAGAAAVGGAYGGSKVLANELFTPQGVGRLTKKVPLWSSPQTGARLGVTVNPAMSRLLSNGPPHLRSPEENQR